MLKIRLQRVGRKNIPVFRIVLTESRNSTKSGKYKEVLGSYDPVNDVKTIKEDRIKYWMSVGAKPTDTLHNFLVEKKIVSGKKVNALPKKRPIKKEAEKKEEAVPATAAPATAADSAETKAETPQEAPAAEAK